MSTAIEPAGTPSLGQGSGFIGPNTLYPSILAAILLCAILTTFFTAARLITKRLISTYDVEDYFLILAWVVNLAYALLLLVAGLDGLGHHVWDITLAELPNIPRLLQFTWALEIVYIPAIWLAKSALLFQLIHIFTPMKSGVVYWACHTLIWGNLAFYVAILFTIIFECHPIDEVWNPYYTDHCINRNTVLVVTGAVNVFSDFLNLLLPIWAIWHLQMAPKRKAGVVAVFGTGILAFVSSICRLIYATHIDVPSGADISFIVVQIGLWALAEVASIILCTCFPMMPRLVKLISDRRAKSKSHSTPPLGQVWKRKSTDDNSNESPSGETNPGSRTTKRVIRLQHPYEHLGDELGDEDSYTSGNGSELQRTDDVELAMWSPFHAQTFGDLLERRLDIGFTLPSFSQP